MNYGRAIRVARAVGGLQQKDLAERAKLDTSYVSLLEKEHRTPSRATVERLSTALGMPIELFELLAKEPEDLRSIPSDEFDKMGQALAEIILLDRPDVKK